MSGLAMGLVLQAALLASGAESYETALQAAKEEGKPMLVLVGADWCPGCVTMKNSTMPAIARAGGLKSVNYITINYDHNPTLARQMMRGGSIPQLVVFSKTEKGWHREQITGATSTGAVAGLVQRALAAQAPVAAAAIVKDVNKTESSSTPAVDAGNSTAGGGGAH